MRRFIVVFCLFLFSGCSSEVPYKIHIVHTNDLHARLEPFSDDGSSCADPAGNDKCLGGFARLGGFFSLQRRQYPDMILLDAGDRFFGTIFYTMHKSRDISMLMNQMNYTAMNIGNHEFDDGLPELERFVASVSAPVVAANVVFPESSPLRDSIKPSVVINRGGRKIGIIGAVTKRTKLFSAGSGETEISSVKVAVRAEIEKLKKENVDIIIIVSHVGFEYDKKMASAIEGIDIIISGHSHILLSNDKEEKDKAGPYPVVISGPSGRPVLIVSAGMGGRHAGVLDVVFDKKGNLIKFEGGTRRMDASVPEDPSIKKQVAAYASEIADIRNNRVAVLKSAAGMSQDDSGTCMKECLLGEVVTDVLHRAFPKADIVLINAGSLRRGLPAGTVTFGDITAVLPFDSEAVFVKMTGREVADMLDRGVRPHKKLKRMNSFFQASGLSYEYLLNRGENEEVINILVGGLPLEPDKVYTVLMNSFTANGGDGNPVQKNQERTYMLVRDAVAGQLLKEKTLAPVLQKRIQEIYE